MCWAWRSALTLVARDPPAAACSDGLPTWRSLNLGFRITAPELGAGRVSIHGGAYAEMSHVPFTRAVAGAPPGGIGRRSEATQINMGPSGLAAWGTMPPGHSWCCPKRDKGDAAYRDELSPVRPTSEEAAPLLDAPRPVWHWSPSAATSRYSAYNSAGCGAGREGQGAKRGETSLRCGERAFRS